MLNHVIYATKIKEIFKKIRTLFLEFTKYSYVPAFYLETDNAAEEIIVPTKSFLILIHFANSNFFLWD